MASFVYCSPSRPCPICGRKKDCRANSDGLIFCLHGHDRQVFGYTYLGPSKDDLWGLYRADSDLEGRRPHYMQGYRQARATKPATAAGPAAATATRPAAPKRDTTKTRDNFLRRSPAVTDADGKHDLGRLQQRLGIPGWVFPLFDTRRVEHHYVRHLTDSVAYGYPEYDAQGNVTSFVVRTKEGQKRAYGPRGVNYSKDFTSLPGPIYLPEGWSDAVALRAMGLAAIARPASSAGAEIVLELLRNDPRECIVLGENDQKEDGRWPGREGAIKLAKRLAEALGKPVRVAFPRESKDVRDWFQRHYQPGRPNFELAKQWAESLDCETVAAEPPLHAAGSDGASLDPQSTLSEECREWLRKIYAEEAKEAKVREEIAAEAVRQLRADHAKHACKDCVSLLMERLDSTRPAVIGRRCEKRDCNGCRLYLIEREIISLARHFANVKAKGGKLYAGWVAMGRWQAMQRRLQRLGAEYVHVRDKQYGKPIWWVVADAPFPGSSEIDPRQAISVIESLLHNWTGEKRPLSTSQGWKLPMPKKQPTYKRIGKVPNNLTMDTIKKIAADVGATVRFVQPTNPRFAWQIEFDREGGWPEKIRQRFYTNLMAGEIIPEIEIPPPQPPTPDGAAIRIETNPDGSLVFVYSD